MNPLRDLPLAQRQLLFVAAVVAVALLSLYVQLLHHSLARGEELREVQRVAGAKKATTATMTKPQPVVLRARDAAEREVAQAR
jgi:hypothetical protein